MQRAEGRACSVLNWNRSDSLKWATPQAMYRTKNNSGEGVSGSLWKCQGTPESTELAARSEHDIRACSGSLHHCSQCFCRWVWILSIICCTCLFSSWQPWQPSCGDCFSLLWLTAHLTVWQLLQEHVYCSLVLSPIEHPVGTCSYRLRLGNLCHLKIAGYTTSYF